MDNLETIAVVGVADNPIKTNETLFDWKLASCIIAPVVVSYMLYQVMKFGSNILNRFESRRNRDNYQI